MTTGAGNEQADETRNPAYGQPGRLVTPCRMEDGYWCRACVETWVPAVDGPMTGVAFEADPACDVCAVQGRCICAPVLAEAVSGRV